MPKRLCACGCGDQVTQNVESQHLNVLAPALLVSDVLAQNRRKIGRKNRSQVSAPFRRQLVMGNTTGIDDMDVDDIGSSMVMGEDLDESYGQLKSCCSTHIMMIFIYRSSRSICSFRR
jgi:hypothetical protein